MQSVEAVIRTLDHLGVTFALIGAHAVALRGHPRMTLDYDFLTTDRRVLERASWSALERAGATIDPRTGDFDDPLGGVVRIALEDGTEADVVVGKWEWEQRVIDRAEVMDVGGIRVRVPHTSDLILLKLSAGGILDLQDVTALLEASRDRESVVREVGERVREVGADAVRAWRQLSDRNAR